MIVWPLRSVLLIRSGFGTRGGVHRTPETGVVVGVVLVVLAERGRKIGLRHAAEGVIGERRLVAVGVGDAGEVVFGIVGVVRDMARRVGDAGQPVGIVIGVRGGLAVLVGHRSAPPARIASEQ